MDAILNALPIWLTPFWVGLVIVRLSLMAMAVVTYGRAADVKNAAVRAAAMAFMIVVPVIWAVIVLTLGSRAYFQINPQTVPPPPVAIAPTLAILTATVLFFVWGAYRRIFYTIPYYWVIAFQSLRATGFVFLILYAQELLPGVFAIPAGIGDIVAGGLALPVAYYCYKQKPGAHTVALWWNWIALFELLALVPIGILSSPGPLQVLALDAPNYITTNWPVVSGPVFHVPLGIILHIYTFAQLADLRRQASGDGQPAPRLNPRAAVIIGAVAVGWLLTIITLARQSFFVLTPQTPLPPPIGIAVALPIIGGYFAFRYWNTWRTYIFQWPIARLISPQIFRIISMLVLIQYALGALPAPFALPVGIGGVVMGFSSLLVAHLYDAQKPWSRRLAISWNWLGIVDLSLAIALGLFTSPIRVQFLALDRPNMLITSLPMVLFPTVIVPLGILLHIYTLVRLNQREATEQAAAPSLAWLVMFYGAVVVSLYVVIFYIAAPLASDRPIGFQIYAGLQQLLAANPISLYVHIVPALLTLIIGPFQLLESFRTRHWQLHRWLGRTYLVSVFLGGLGALYMAQFSFAGLGARLGFSVQAILLLFTGYMAYSAIRQRAFSTHREWMIRNYALIFGAVTLRLYIRTGFEFGYDLPDFHALNAWLCWVPNLIFVEWLIRRGRSRMTTTPQTMHAAGAAD